MAKQLLGKEVVAALNERIIAKAEALKANGVTPTLGIVRVGENESDLSYERGATKRCEKLGVEYKKYLLPADATQEYSWCSVIPSASKTFKSGRDRTGIRSGKRR